RYSKSTEGTEETDLTQSNEVTKKRKKILGSSLLLCFSVLISCLCPFRSLKDVFQRELQDPRIGRRQNLPEGRAVQRQRRRGRRLRLPWLQPLEPVQRVERFGAELQHLRADMERP